MQEAIQVSKGELQEASLLLQQRAAAVAADEHVVAAKLQLVEADQMPSRQHVRFCF